MMTLMTCVWYDDQAFSCAVDSIFKDMTRPTNRNSRETKAGNATRALMPEPHPMSSNKHGRSGSNSNSSARSVILGSLRMLDAFFPTTRLMLPMGNFYKPKQKKPMQQWKVRGWKSLKKVQPADLHSKKKGVSFFDVGFKWCHGKCTKCQRLKHQDTSFESQSSDC